MMYTDIVCTIGPKTHTKEAVVSLAKAGMTVMRCNFSHCTPKEYAERLRYREAAEKATGRKIAVLADLQGPRIRVKGVPSEGVSVEAGDELVFVTNNAPRRSGEIGVDDPYLHSDVSVGDSILIANGAIESVVRKVLPHEHRIVVEILNDGVIYPNKGLNMPNTKLTTSCLTDKDREDIKYLNKKDFDYVALSFVQSASDIKELRKLFNKKVKVIVKLERQEAIKNLDEIIDEADGVMVARGDLGVEMPFAEVPIVQKRIIRKCNARMKPVIVATQMLLSMVKEPFPTRAEVSDIANALYDGAHGVMLSDETANGDYALEAVKTMATVVARVEQELG